MKCPFCAKEFDEQEARKGCANCFLTSGCQMLCCPHCGYEIPREPNWIKRFNSWRKKK